MTLEERLAILKLEENMRELIVGIREIKEKIKEKIKDLISRKDFSWLGERIQKKRLKKFKGSLKDPFFYLGIMTITLFGGIIFFTPSLFNQAFSSTLLLDYLIKEEPFLVSETKVKESPPLALVQRNSLTAISPPIIVTPQVLGALIEASDYQKIKKEVIEYTVQPADTLSSIAKRFNITLNTLLWANNLNKNSLLQIGQKLIIPPVSGVIHHVKKGETLSQIAQIYQADLKDIAAFNELSAVNDIYIGDILIIPDGVMPKSVRYTPSLAPLASSYFICPISPPCRITQGLHWYNAIDFSHGQCGEPIYAVASGEVLKVKLTNSLSPWVFGGIGNHLTILHPNGVVTIYGHLQTSLVKPGDKVYQGQIIALMGGQPGRPGAGNSTGCHLHFGVRGARNPFAP